MGQTSDGAKRAAQTLRKKYGEDYFSRISKLGDHSKYQGYFATVDPAELKKIASKGGKARKGYRKKP